MAARESGRVIHELFPYLCVRGAASAIDFYTQVFDAEETLRMTAPDGRVGHAELKLGPATLMLADEYPEYGIRSQLKARAVAAGATVLREPADQEHGERQCRIRDPFGHEWLLGHQIEREEGRS